MTRTKASTSSAAYITIIIRTFISIAAAPEATFSSAQAGNDTAIPLWTTSCATITAVTASIAEIAKLTRAPAPRGPRSSSPGAKARADGDRGGRAERQRDCRGEKLSPDQRGPVNGPGLDQRQVPEVLAQVDAQHRRPEEATSATTSMLTSPITSASKTPSDVTASAATAEPITIAEMSSARRDVRPRSSQFFQRIAVSAGPRGASRKGWPVCRDIRAQEVPGGDGAVDLFRRFRGGFLERGCPTE